MLDMHSEMLVDEFREYMPYYEKINEIVVKQLHNTIDELNMNVDSISSRVKTEKSLIGKLERKGEKYKSMLDITDIVGARVVTFYTDEVDKVASSVIKVFDVDWTNSVDKRKDYGIDQFGYMSLHYICKIPKTLYYDEKNPKINEISFELQIRTTLQHAWASVEHDIGYKTDVEIPKIYLRSFSRLAGLLEIADEEFKNIRTSIAEYRKKVVAVVKSGNFSDAELNGDTFNAYLNSGAYDSLNKRIAEINNMDIIEVSLTKYLQTFVNFGFTTLADVENMRKEYSEQAYQFALRQFGETDIDIISSAVGINLLCTVYILSKGYGEVVLKLFYDKVNGERKSNETSAKNAVEIAKKLDIIK